MLFTLLENTMSFSVNNKKRKLLETKVSDEQRFFHCIDIQSWFNIVYRNVNLQASNWNDAPMKEGTSLPGFLYKSQFNILMQQF